VFAVPVKNFDAFHNCSVFIADFNEAIVMANLFTLKGKRKEVARYKTAESLLCNQKNKNYVYFDIRTCCG